MSPWIATFRTDRAWRSPPKAIGFKMRISAPDRYRIASAPWTSRTVSSAAIAREREVLFVGQQVMERAVDRGSRRRRGGCGCQVRQVGDDRGEPVAGHPDEARHRELEPRSRRGVRFEAESRKRSRVP